MTDSAIGIVVIGRNEGERLKKCLASVHGKGKVVYVDSGSTDGSLEHARSVGTAVVELDTRTGFTAARARNAGLDAIVNAGGLLDYVQFVDADCELNPDWIAAGADALDGDARLSTVFGRLRERHPEASLYNRLCDDEWNVPLGDAAHSGGVAMYRAQPLLALGGFDASLIAGEEPDLCLRLRREGWTIRRIDAEMGWHDAAMTRFSQWWKRAARSGHAYTEHVWRHGKLADSGWKRQLASICVWGLALPLVFAAALLAAMLGTRIASAAAAAILFIYVLQWLRIAHRKWVQTRSPGFAAAYSASILLSKFAGVSGSMRFLASRISGSAPQIIEYKAPGR